MILLPVYAGWFMEVEARERPTRAWVARRPQNFVPPGNEDIFSYMVSDYFGRVSL